MTRIIAGEFSGRRLRTPPGSGTRPTTDRVREALFASLQTSADLADGPFLDIYAGSGAVGLEAISRGAPHAYFVENARGALATIRDNIATLGLAQRTTVLGTAAAAAVPKLADLAATTAFLDPPYALSTEAVGDLLSALHSTAALERDALVIVERDARSPWAWPTRFEALRDRRYGETHLWYGRPL